MARWRLLTGHYLNTVDSTEWEHTETDRGTGKAMRARYIVPLFMDPRDAADHNYPGEIIVASPDGEHERKDILFKGDPTADMEPLDEEAEVISAKLRERWEHPIETLPANGGMDSREMAFMKQMMESFSRGLPPAATVPNNTAIPGPSMEEFNEMKRLLEDMKAQLTTQQPSSPVPSERRL